MKAARLALHFVMITINCVARFHVDDSVYLFYSRWSAVYSYRCGLQRIHVITPAGLWIGVISVSLNSRRFTEEVRAIPTLGRRSGNYEGEGVFLPTILRNRIYRNDTDSNSRARITSDRVSRRISVALATRSRYFIRGQSWVALRRRR